MASVVHLVRHGEVHNPDHTVYADLPGFHLSERGRRQATWAGRHLSDRPVAAVYTSPLERAVETAGAIGAHHGLAPEGVAELTEWALMGRWRGLRWPDLDTRRPGELETYLTSPLTMDFTPETVQQLADRVGGAVTLLARRHPGEEIVIVSHQDPIQVTRLALTNRSLGALHEAKPRHCEIISLAPGARWRETGRRVPDAGARSVGG